uniref:Uncharacterized protein n=1 Tax=Romanomermis culicivorax TaxID=13658 RepID=A0A915K8A1_ROMCU
MSASERYHCRRDLNVQFVDVPDGQIDYVRKHPEYDVIEQRFFTKRSNGDSEGQSTTSNFFGRSYADDSRVQIIDECKLDEEKLESLLL